MKGEGSKGRGLKKEDQIKKSKYSFIGWEGDQELEGVGRDGRRRVAKRMKMCHAHLQLPTISVVICTANMY